MRTQRPRLTIKKNSATHVLAGFESLAAAVLVDAGVGALAAVGGAGGLGSSEAQLGVNILVTYAKDRLKQVKQTTHQASTNSTETRTKVAEYT